MDGSKQALRRANARELGRWRDLLLSPTGPTDAGSKLCAFGIAKFVNLDTLNTFASCDTIGSATGQGPRTVRDRIQRLVAEEFLTIERRSGTGRDWKTPYLRIRFPSPRSANGADHHPPRSANGADHSEHRWPANPASMVGKPCTQGRQELPTNSVLNSESELHTPLPPERGDGVSHAIRRKSPDRERRDKGRQAWSAICRAVDRVKGTERSWDWARREIDDEAAHQAIEQLGGYKTVADRTRFTSSELMNRFRQIYEAQLE